LIVITGSVEPGDLPEAGDECVGVFTDECVAGAGFELLFEDPPQPDKPIRAAVARAAVRCLFMVMVNSRDDSESLD
jgi:hypothetical protein